MPASVLMTLVPQLCWLIGLVGGGDIQSSPFVFLFGSLSLYMTCQDIFLICGHKSLRQSLCNDSQQAVVIEMPCDW